MIQERTANISKIQLTACCFLLTLFQLLLPSATLADERIGFTVPAAPWTLTLPKGVLVIEQQKVSPDGRQGYYSLYDENNKMSISFFIEPVKNCKDSKTCRDMVWKLGNPSWENPQNFIQSEIDDVSYFEFFIPSSRGKPVKQQHMYAEFVKDGFWVDMHISKVLYKPEEHEMFERVIKSIEFEPKNQQSKKKG